MQEFNTIFLSIIIEALPLVLVGVFVSAFIHAFVPTEWIQRRLPRRRITGIIAACLFGVVLPLCECSMAPIIRRLIYKGVPPYIAITFMLSAPIINPLVGWSTYLAFSAFPAMVFYRLFGAFIAIMVIALLISRYRSHQVLVEGHAAATHGCCGHHQHRNPSQSLTCFATWRTMLYHSCDEFIDIGRFLLIGSFLAALIQVTVPRLTLLSFGQDPLYSVSGMMFFAFMISVCSQADAFIAAPFLEHFTTGSLAGFLIFGPMLDIKNSIMLFTVFKPLFILKLVLLITVVVFGVCLSMVYYPGIWEAICFVRV